MTKLSDSLKSILAPARAAIQPRYSQTPTAFVSGQPELGDLVRMESVDGKHHLVEVVVEDIQRDAITEGANTMLQFVHEVEERGLVSEPVHTIDDFNAEMKSEEKFDGEFFRRRGYDIEGKRIDYDLRTLTFGGEITNSASDRTVWLQGDDFYALEASVEEIWKQVRWKKIGKTKAQLIQNDLLSEYFGD